MNRSLLRPARIVCLGLFLAVAGAWAQRQQEDNDPAGSSSPTPTPPAGLRKLWIAEMPAGDYMVRLSAITSVSMHEYVVDATAKVTEVNIATSGSELARFYFIEPNKPKSPDGIGQSTINLVEEKQKELLNRAGVDEVWQKVVKNYPTTTHAHTVEYRVDSRDTLDKLLKSLQEAWKDDRPATFKP